MTSISFARSRPSSRTSPARASHSTLFTATQMREESGKRRFRANPKPKEITRAGGTQQRLSSNPKALLKTKLQTACPLGGAYDGQTSVLDSEVERAVLSPYVKKAIYSSDRVFVARRTEHHKGIQRYQSLFSVGLTLRGPPSVTSNSCCQDR